MLPLTASELNVPTCVMFVCVLVVNVPAILVALILPNVPLPVTLIKPPVKLFYQERNYRYFLKLWTDTMDVHFEVWSYCLMPNH